MPTVDVPEIRVKTAFNGEVMITYIDPKITVDQLRYEMMVICRFSPDQDFTMKWVDEEGDPCILSTQMELDEAVRLYELNKDSELTIHGKSNPFPHFHPITQQIESNFPHRVLF